MTINLRRSVRGASTLTGQEIAAAQLARFDLGPGYPQLDLPDFVRYAYLDDRIEDASLKFAPDWNPVLQETVDSNIEHALSKFLGINPARYHSAHVVFSGGIALDRAITACRNMAREGGHRGLDVITTTPSIDIMRLLLEERSDVRPTFVRSRSDGVVGRLGTDALVKALESSATRRPYRAHMVLLSSPENPTGEFWSGNDLSQIVEACKEHDAVLLMDHSFLVSGVHGRSIPRIWNVADPELDWIAVWDTGKTFGLNEEKLGFLFASNQRVTEALEKSIAVLQFGVARRHKLFFARVMLEALKDNYLDTLRHICQTNLSILCTAMENAGAKTLVPPSGSLALVDCRTLGPDDEMVRRALMEAKVGVVTGSVFFHDSWKPRNLIRVALARNPEHFRAAAEIMTKVLGAL